MIPVNTVKNIVHDPVNPEITLGLVYMNLRLMVAKSSVENMNL